VKGWLTGLAVSGLKTVVLVISDVPNDDLSTIGSGPFYNDSTTFIAARNILESYGIWDSVPTDIRDRIEAGVAGKIPETPKPGALSISHRIIASNAIARETARQKAMNLGYEVEVMPETLVDSVEEAVTKFAQQSKRIQPGSAFIAGGETTIRVQGSGIGGRNQHLAMLMAKTLAGTDFVFLAAGTDGVDGNSPAAGAWVDGNTIQKAQSQNLKVDEFINNYDSFHFFELLNQSIHIGPTGTNVMDLYILLRAKL
jgi:glycerate-2-kinase